MKTIKLRSLFNIALLFLILPFGWQNQKASALAIQAEFPPPPHLEPNAIKTQNNGRINQSSTNGFNPLKADDVITNIFGDGDNQVHGLIFYMGSLWASTRTTPARILRINPSTLAVEKQIILASGQNEAEDITAGQGYVWTITDTSPAQLIRINPATDAATAIPFQISELNNGVSLKYALGYLWAGGINHLVKIDISDPLAPINQVYDFTSLKTATIGYVWLTALTSSSDRLWGVFSQFDLDPLQNKFFASTIIKIDPSNPTGAYVTNTVSSLFPDDITYAGINFYASSEISPTQTTPSFVFKFNENLLAYTTKHVSDSASYGTFLNPNEPTYFWGAYVASPGKLLKFDLNSNIIMTITLPPDFNDPSEIAFDDAGNMYVTTWQIPSGIVKYTVSEISSDLAITKTAMPDPAIAGQELRYTLNISNSGPSGATNVVVTDSLPPEVTFLTSSPGLPTCAESNGKVTCNPGTLLTNENIQITINVKVKPSTSGKISNTATISSSENDQNNSNNNATLDTPVIHHIINIPIISR